MGRQVSYTEADARAAVAASQSFAESLRRLGLCPTGGAGQTLIPLDDILVEGSTYHRGKLKERLFEAGLRQRRCQLCGQGESWRGRPMSLILDHINGISNDNRIGNLRIVCPNCAATLDTHCGRKLRLEPRRCLLCGNEFKPKYADNRYCSAWCGQRHDRPYQRGPRPESRKVERPPYERLLAEVERMGYCTTARKYGVSDNAIRKWIRAYEHDLAEAA